jgi:hypothetical protein
MCPPTNSTSASSSTLIVDFAFDQQQAARMSMAAASPPTRIRRRLVRFEPTTQIAEVDGLWQMTDAEIESTYRTAEDAAANRDEMRRTIKALRKNKPIANDNEMSYRGLEHFRTNDVLTKLQNEKERVVYVVLAAQEAGATSAEIAHLSSLATKKAAARAMNMGAMDADEVAKDNKTDIILAVLHRVCSSDNNSLRSSPAFCKKIVAFK